MRTYSLLQLASALLLVAATSAQATDYYACDCTGTGASNCTGQGNDSTGDGSLNNPYQTFGRMFTVKWATSSCGDTFNLCRGGATNLGSNNYNFSARTSCPSGRERMWEAYTPAGSAATAKPILSRTSGSSGLFTVTGPGTALDHEIGFKNLHLRCYPYSLCDNTGARNARAPTGAAITLEVTNFNVTGVQIIDNEIDGWGQGIIISGSHSFGGLHNSATITGNSFHDIAAQGIIGAAGSHTHIENNTFDRIACRHELAGTPGSNACVYQHNVYINTVRDQTDLTFKNNTVTHPNLTSDDTTPLCDGTILKLFNGTWTITGNTINVDQSTGPPSGNCSPMAMGQQGTGNQNDQGCINCVASNNIINGGTWGISIAGWQNGLVENNVINEWNTGIAFPTNAGYQFFTCLSIGVKSGSTALPMDGVIIRNNSCYMEDFYDGNWRRVYALEMNDLGSEPGNISFYGNAVHIATSAAGSGNQTVWSIPSNNLSKFTVFASNVVGITGPGARNASWAGAYGSTLATFDNNTCGSGACDANSYNGAPGYVSPGTGLNLKLAAGANAIGRGYSIGPATDILGNARVSPYDAGAYKYDPGTGTVLGAPGRPTLVP